MHHVCFYRILEFTHVSTFLISSCRWLLTWSNCQDKHLQRGTSAVLLWPSQCIQSVKWKMTQTTSWGPACVCTLRHSKQPWMLHHTEVSWTLCHLLFSCIGQSKSTPTSPSWCLYAVFHYLPLMERKTRSEICRRTGLIYLLELARQY